MLYALLCYNSEEMVFSWTKAQDDAVMATLGVIQDRPKAQGKLGPSLRLMPTTTATTLRKPRNSSLASTSSISKTSMKRWRRRAPWERPTPGAPMKSAPFGFSHQARLGPPPPGRADG